MINIFEEAFKANVALNAEKLNESLVGKKPVSEAVATDSYETKFRQLLADSDNLTTGYFGEKDTEISDFGFRLYSQAAAIDVEFDPKTEKYSVKITDEEDSGFNEERTGRGFNELIAELEDLTSDGYTWFMNLENAFDYYKLDESLEEDVNEVEIKTDDEEIEIHIDDEGKVDVDVSEPTEADEVEDSENIEDTSAEELIDELDTEDSVDEETIENEEIEEGIFDKFKKKKDTDEEEPKPAGYSDSDYIVITQHPKTGTYHYVQGTPPRKNKSQAEDDMRFIDRPTNNIYNHKHKVVTYKDAKRMVGRPFREAYGELEEGLFGKNKKNTKSSGTFKVIDGQHKFTVKGGFKTKDDAYDWLENNKEPEEYSKFSVVAESIKESVALNKIRFTEDVDSFQPEDELMIVYNSDLDDEMTEEEIQAEAESLIGCDICKCGVCGANYVCKENEIPDAQDIVVIDEEDVEDGTIEEVEETEEDFNMEESLLFRHLKEAEGEEEIADEETGEENVEEVSTEETNEAENERCNMVCPICGATENQVLTATIAPIEDNLENEEPVEDVEETSEVAENDETTEEDVVTESIGSDGIFVTGNELVALEPIFYSNIDDLGWEQSDIERFEKLGYIEDGKVVLPRGTKFVVGEKAPSGNGVMIKLVKANEELEFVYEDENDDRFLVTDVAEEISECAEETKETTHLAEATLEIDESSLNRLFTKFARENYENVVNVRINDGKLVDGQICLEGYVRTTSGVKRDIKLVSEGLNISENTSKVKIIEKGPFTEDAQVKSNRCPFVLECNVSENKMSFTGLKYNYTINESKESFSVSGKVSITE